MRIKEVYIENYRTIEQIRVNFSEGYTAICGKNNAGKTNFLNALKIIFNDEDDGYGFSRTGLVSAESDFPKWKEYNENTSAIIFDVIFVINPDIDIALYQFIKRQLKIDDSRNFSDFQLKLKYIHGKQEPSVSLTIETDIHEGIEADEILKRLRNSNLYIFHNSTRSGLQSSFRQGIGQISEFSNESRAILSGLKSEINKKIKKASKEQESQFGEILGKLGEKYSVSITLPSFDFSWMPFNLTLGDKKVDVPLDKWGSGTQNRTMILLALFRARQLRNATNSAEGIQPIVFVEEPESFLHPSAQAEFGRILHDLSVEFGVQLIVSTHSPYLMNLSNPNSNILLERKVSRGQPHATSISNTNGENWMEPFSQALGLSPKEFEPWKALFGNADKRYIFVEGAIDVSYFKLLKDPRHGETAIPHDVEIYPYDGSGNIANNAMIRFIRNAFPCSLITFDRDQKASVEKVVQSVGLTEDKDYFILGISDPGKDCIEGMLPDHVISKVSSDNPSLMMAMTSVDTKVKKESKSKFKKLLLDEFTLSCVPGDDYAGFHPLMKKIHKALSLMK